MSRVAAFHESVGLARGAALYAAQMGNHRGNYQNVSIAPEHQESLARAYEAAPNFDPAAVPAFRAMRNETNRQFDYLTNPPRRGGLGVSVETQDHDPYANSEELTHDLLRNRHLAVLNTQSTGGHPFFSNDENDRFRAVHDAFGHVATNRGFDRHGEEAAFRSHATMYSPIARKALATETRGQNAVLIRRGAFAPQKIAVLPGASAIAPIYAQHLLAQSQQFRGVIPS